MLAHPRKYLERYGTVRVVASNSIESSMDNDLTYSVRNQDLA